MNVALRVLLIGLSSIAVFAQTPTYSAVNYGWTESLNRYTGPAAPGGTGIVSDAAPFRAAEPFTCRPYDNSTGLGLSLLRPNDCQGAPSGIAKFRMLTPPFSHTTVTDRFDYFPIKVGRLRYTFWSGDPQAQRPEGGRLQSLVDGLLRHYTSDPVVPVNKRCIRTLSCNSLYEQALRRRAVVR